MKIDQIIHDRTEVFVRIDEGSGVIINYFNWDGEKPLPEDYKKVEKYDPVRHPPMGSKVPVGEGWESRPPVDVDFESSLEKALAARALEVNAQ